MEKKYELTDNVINHNGRTLYRIRALRDFSDVKAGDLGGYVQTEYNLSHEGNAWVDDYAKVYDDARVSCDAFIRSYAIVYGRAKIYDKAIISGYAKIHGEAEVRDYAHVWGDVEVCGKAVVSGNAYIRGDAKVNGKADYIVFKNFWSSGRYFIWTRSNNRWAVGSFDGTGEELINKAYADSEKSGREYKRVVRYVESILADEEKGIEYES